MKKLFVAVGLMLALAGSANAQRSASKLASDCRIAVRYMDSSSSAPASDFVSGIGCVAYVAGWFDLVANSTYALDNNKAVNVQFAEGVTVGQIVRVFVKYVDAHPEEENKPAYGVLLNAVVAAHLVVFTEVHFPGPSETH